MCLCNNKKDPAIKILLCFFFIRISIFNFALMNTQFDLILQQLLNIPSMYAYLERHLEIEFTTHPRGYLKSTWNSSLLL